MIGLLDPTLFLSRAEAEVVRDLEIVLRACREHNIELTPLREYWPALWQELGSTLERQLSPQARRTLQAVRSAAPSSDAHIAALSPNAGGAWRRGFFVLFDGPHLQPPWTDRMALAVIRAVSHGQSAVMFCRRVDGRNLVIHRAGNSTLHENTRWVLHVQPSGVGPRQVLCVHHPRNLREHWTSRFDWRLPGASDGARYPFCVPPQWWKGSTRALRTVSSKPAWVDAHGNGWARPNINCGAGYHWDVFIQDAQAKQAIGADQINVVEFGVPVTEGRPGHLHHVPSAKQGHVTDAGWSC
jgi:hypothetical protein